MLFRGRLFALDPSPSMSYSIDVRHILVLEMYAFIPAGSHYPKFVPQYLNTFHIAYTNEIEKPSVEVAPARDGVEVVGAGIFPSVRKAGRLWNEATPASQFQTLSSEITPTTSNGWDPGNFLESSVSVGTRVDTMRAYGHRFSLKRCCLREFTTQARTRPIY